MKIQGADVNYEAIVHLDHAMFDHSEEASAAGNEKWGLDVGMHEDNWNPYNLFAPERDESWWEVDESELKLFFYFDI